jgi:hypothetical protein
MHLEGRLEDLRDEQMWKRSKKGKQRAVEEGAKRMERNLLWYTAGLRYACACTSLTACTSPQSSADHSRPARAPAKVVQAALRSTNKSLPPVITSSPVPF